MKYIWTDPVTNSTVVGNQPPYEEGLPYAETTDDVTPNTHYLATTGEALVMPPKPLSDELWEFDPTRGEWVSPITEATRAENLVRAREEVIRHVNYRSGKAREQFITPITGQEMTYAEKEAEARAYLADPAPVLSDYPYIAGEVGLDADTPEAVAQIFLNLGAHWREVGAVLETHRRTFSTRVNTAIDAVRVQELRDEFDVAHTALLGGLS